MLVKELLEKIPLNKRNKYIIYDESLTHYDKYWREPKLEQFYNVNNNYDEIIKKFGELEVEDESRADDFGSIWIHIRSIKN